MDRPDGPASTNDGERIAALQATVERLELELAQSRELQREASAAGRSQAQELKLAVRKYEVLRGRRSVRLVVDVMTRGRALVDAVRSGARAPGRAIRGIRRLIRDWVRGRGLGASPAAEAALLAALRGDRLPIPPDDGPLVSIVIVNRSGREQLERCRDAVATTAYRNIEVVVVDASSQAIRDGVAGASGELVCLLDSGVEPITDHWLGYLVETLTATGASGVGSRLIYPRQRGAARATRRFADLTLRHGGVAFERSEAIPMPRSVGAGADPLGPEATAVGDRPALSTACLLVRRAAFDAIGGALGGSDDRLEGVDLSLHLRAAGGRLVYDGRAALWHRGPTTGSAHERERYVDRWGPRIFREALLDALTGDRAFSSAPFHVAITPTSHGPEGTSEDGDTAHELGAALAALGWRVSYLDSSAIGSYEPDPSIEAVIVLLDSCDIRRLPRKLVTVAWLRDRPERWTEQPWFDDFDVVVASSEPIVELVRERTAKVAGLLPVATNAAAAIRDALVAWGSSIRYGLRLGIPSRGVAEGWGDYHFGRALQRSLERAGHPTRLHLLPEWGDPVTAREDVSVHVFGRKQGPSRPSQVNLLWHISHPDLATAALYEAYDHVFVASDPFASRMAPLARVPVTPLHQATDPERFWPDPTGPRHELLFVANSRFVRRPIVDDLAGTRHDLAVYGRDWGPELIDPRFVKGKGIPNTEVRRYYSSADIVLNDHWADMRSEGFISNRLYDALACGAFVISDHIDGIEAEFDDAVVTYERRAQLEALIDRYLADPDERRRRGERGRAAVRERHTFDARARVLCEAADPIVASRPARIIEVHKPAV